jgi:LytS/YehU family sensor histidine kinase
MLIELREELNFIQSFIFLQKIRFNDNLNVNIKVDAAFMNSYIPPLSVQLLLENAIKHNEISTEYPLSIDIYVEDSYLIMKNNIRLKITLEKSTGIGLKNLEERYKHFTEKATSFVAINNEFIAKLPLLSENEL